MSLDDAMICTKLVYFKDGAYRLEMPVKNVVGYHAWIGSANDVEVPVPSRRSLPGYVGLLIPEDERHFRLHDLTGGRLSVNGMRLLWHQAIIQDGDVIQIGDFDLKLKTFEKHPCETPRSRPDLHN